MTDTTLSVLNRWGFNLQEEDLRFSEKFFAAHAPAEGVICSRPRDYPSPFHCSDQDKDYANVEVYDIQGSVESKRLCLTACWTNLSEEGAQIREALTFSLLADVIKGIEEQAELLIQRALRCESAPEMTQQRIPIKIPHFPEINRLLEKYDLTLEGIYKSHLKQSFDNLKTCFPRAVTEFYRLPLPTPGSKTVFVGIRNLNLFQRKILSETYPCFTGFAEGSIQEGKMSIYQDYFVMPIAAYESLQSSRTLGKLPNPVPPEKCQTHDCETDSLHATGYPFISSFYDNPCDGAEFRETLRTLAKENKFSEALKLAQALTQSL